MSTTFPGVAEAAASAARDTPIADHGLIGDLQTCALVAADSTIDWFCCPRFDAPSVFASLLDTDRGGYLRVVPTSAGCVTRQMYLPGTAILLTRFMSDDGVAELVDFMPIAGSSPTERHRIVRLLRGVRGEMRFRFECSPRFDYGRAEHKTELFADGVAFHGEDGTDLTLHVVRRANVAPHDRPAVEHDDGAVRATIDIHAGEIGGVVVESAPTAPPHAVPKDEILDLFVTTRDYWRSWVARSTYTGRWREHVDRSAITLKLLTYEPTGAPIAAATLGLPEQVGGERNWDYRYTWVRDGSFSVHALLSLGYTEEASAFVRWLGDRLDGDEPVGAAPPLKIMYRVDGSSDLDEVTLPGFDGWRASRPVRVGNGASDQLQLDIYGEALDAIFLGDRNGIAPTHRGWAKIRRLVDWLADNWQRPEEGIWETRGGQKAFTYGRLMSWVAFDRAIRMARDHGKPARLDEWERARDAVYDEIMTRGWSDERQAFVQHDETSVLDAALLYMPLVGFIAGHDERWQSTLAAMEQELVSDSLVYRYDPSASPDGLVGHEGTFSICTFWYVDALARSGRLDDARLTFEKMLTYTNHVGLFAEEIGPTGEQLGNFPQAFSHLSLIRAAVTLDRALDGSPDRSVV